MFITCQECKATYCIADKLIGPNGKMVKCTKCQNVWLAIENKDNKEASGSNNFIYTLCLSLTLIGIIGLSLIIFPENLMQFKPLANLYARFGVHNSQDIILDEVKFTTNGNELLIEGNILNTNSQDKFLPKLRYTLLDQNKQIIFKQTQTLDTAIIGPGSLYQINSKIINIPDKIAYLQIDIGNKLELLWR